MDALRDVALEFTEMKTELNIEKIEEIRKTIQEMVRSLFLSMQKDTQRDGIGIILDDSSLDVQKCNELYGSEDNIIYCLGTSKITPKEMEQKIREHDTIHDWSLYISSKFISSLCKNSVRDSKENRKKCMRLKNIKYVDTSHNREEVLDEIVEDLKNQI